MRRRKARPEVEMTPERAVEAILAHDAWGLLRGLDHPALQSFSWFQRARIFVTARRIDRRRRAAEREPELRRRLKEWPVDMWGSIFCERPDFEERLTDEQRAQWQGWLASQGISDQREDENDD
ncbi:MAG: hypothetical protein KJZ78_21890 [Bryobacteraceae bacterium]|nr:hypothetical protein [Bryobacteraceae bacterium]